MEGLVNVFLVLLKWEVGAILGNGCGVQGQDYVAWLQGSKMLVGGWWGGKGAKVMRCQGEKSGRVVKWKGGRFLVLLKGGEHGVSPRFYFFASDVNQGNELVA